MAATRTDSNDPTPQARAEEETTELPRGGPRRRLVRLVLVVFMVLMVGPTASAAAVDWDWRKVDILPSFIDGDGADSGIDCTSPPYPQRADSGVYGWLDPGKTTSRIMIPEKDRKPIKVKIDGFGTFKFNGSAVRNPFQENATVSIYEVYGYAGLTVHQYDRGDVKGCLPSWNAAVQASNLMSWIEKSGQALTVRLYSFVFSGLSLLQTFQDFSAKVTGYALLLPLLSIGLIFTAFYFALRARHGDVADATAKSLGTGVIVTLGVAAALYPIMIGGAVDKGMAGVLSATSDQVSSQRAESAQKPPDAATAVAGNLHEAILWPAWKDSWFGRENSKTAEKYGPALFASMAFSRYETDLVKKDPSKADALVKGKQRSFRSIAEKIKSEDPAAYQYVSGKQTGDQVGTWFISMIGTLFALGPFLYALCRFLYAMVLTRVGIAIAPAVALITQFPRFQKKALDMGKYIGMGIVAACAFGAYSMIYVVAGVGTILSPENSWHPLLKMLVLALMNLAAWRLARRLGIVDQRTVRQQVTDHATKIKKFRRKARRERRRRAPEEPTLKPQPAPGPGPDGPLDGGYYSQVPQPAPPALEPPREASLKTRVLKAGGKGAVKGAATTAVAGAATGGTVTVGAMVAGGAKGAVVEVFRPKKKDSGGSTRGRRGRRDRRRGKNPQSPTYLPTAERQSRLRRGVNAARTRTKSDTPKKSQPLAPTAIYQASEKPATPATRKAKYRTERGQRVYDVYVPTNERVNP